MEHITFRIEIICRPHCPKCGTIEEKIRAIVSCMSSKEQVPITCEFKYNKNILDVSKYGYSAMDLPVVLINGSVAFVRPFKNERLVRIKLEQALKGPQAY